MTDNTPVHDRFVWHENTKYSILLSKPELLDLVAAYRVNLAEHDKFVAYNEFEGIIVQVLALYRANIVALMNKFQLQLDLIAAEAK